MNDNDELSMDELMAVTGAGDLESFQALEVERKKRVAAPEPASQEG